VTDVSVEFTQLVKTPNLEELPFASVESEVVSSSQMHSSEGSGQEQDEQVKMLI